MKKNFSFVKGKIFLLLSVFALTVFCLTSCKSKEEGVIADLTDLVEKVENKGADFTDEDWETIVKDYETITKVASECEFTDEQLKEVATLEGKFMAKAGKVYLKNAFDKAGSLLKGVTEGITEGLGE